jgi:hypothetical protein
MISVTGTGNSTETISECRREKLRKVATNADFTLLGVSVEIGLEQAQLIGFVGGAESSKSVQNYLNWGDLTGDS